jgi:hypothetical protein
MKILYLNSLLPSGIQETLNIFLISELTLVEEELYLSMKNGFSQEQKIYGGLVTGTLALYSQ